MTQHTRLILASGSPRRRELLSRMGYSFETCSPNVDDHAEGRADEIVAMLAQRKARSAALLYENGIVIASDTLVSLDGCPLGKPVDAQDARRMLKQLSGREHEVFTGVCLLNAATGTELQRTVRTGVLFRRLSSQEINDYVDSGDPMDKAGAYGIQGAAGAFVERLDGSYENVMGFPVDDVREMLEQMMD